jgi:hypothetical protein
MLVIYGWSSSIAMVLQHLPFINLMVFDDSGLAICQCSLPVTERYVRFHVEAPWVFLTNMDATGTEALLAR